MSKDAPLPKGKFVTLTYFVDAIITHCTITYRYITGILHFLNKTLSTHLTGNKQQLKEPHMVHNILSLAHVLRK